jgi:protocatechuate 3,4-dioxygenase beta subunit
VSSPLLWPWAGDGVVLVPAGAAAQRRVDWDAVFTHELAHLRRRDHRGLLVSNLLVIALPWQPLAWWCRRQIARLADLACDDWVLAAGHARADYAGALLAFVPARGRAWAQAAVSNGGTLRERIRRILESRRAAPLVGRGWGWAAGALALLVALALACAQPGEPAAAGTTHEHEVAGQQRAGSAGVSIDGVVRDAAGQPREGVTVRAAVDGERGYELRRTTATDASGRFRFEALDPELRWMVSADDPDSARQWIGERHVELKDASTPIELVLQPPQTLSGTVRNEEGQPVAGARVTLIREFPVDERKPLQGHGDQDLAVTTTDAQGRFSLDRLRPGWVALMLDHPDYARTFTGLPRPQAGQQDVELVIERGYTLSGRVMANGQPLAGVAIEASTPNLSHRPIGEWSVRTDQLGRFELRGVSTKLSRTTAASVFPMVTLSIDDPHWSSPEYRVFDEGKPELPDVELQAAPRDPNASNAPSIDVNRPTNGTAARLAGEPAGTATLSVVLDGPPRFSNGRAREIWLGAVIDGQELYRHVRVDDDGRVTFDQLPAGEYSLASLSLEPPNFPRMSVTLAEGDTREETLRPGGGQLWGWITCGGARVTHGAIDVNIWQVEPDNGFLQGSGVVKPDGTWEASGLPYGRYRITYDNSEGGHSVPNYFVVEVSQPDTRLDLVLPQTRVDFRIAGRETKPAGYDKLDPDEQSWLDLQVYPGGNAPMGGNTAGLVSVADGQPYVEHLPPGRWTLRTRDTDRTLMAARVVLPDATSRVEATLTRVDAGTATIEGRLLGFEPDQSASDHWIDVTAYPDDPAGLDVTAAFGKVTIEGDRYRIERLPAGRYALLVATEAVRPNGNCVAPLYIPDVVVADGAHLERDLELQPGRLVKLQARLGGEPTYLSTWRVALGGGDDWLPFHLFIGSDPRASVTAPSEFMLPVGEHRLEVTFRGEAPTVRTIRVEPGEGVQTIDIVH